MALRRCLLFVLGVMLPFNVPAAQGSAPPPYRVDVAGVGSCYDADLSLMLPGHVFAYLQPGLLEVYFPQPAEGIGQRERVQPLGDQIDGFAGAASGYVIETVLGKDVLLAFDSSMRSPSGALLAYIYLLDGTCVNLVLIRGGSARVAPPEVSFQFRDEFEMYEKQARDKRRGMWARLPVTPRAGP